MDALCSYGLPGNEPLLNGKQKVVVCMGGKVIPASAVVLPLDTEW